MIAPKLLVALATLFAMEGAACLVHRYIMHGPLWVLHESHHQPSSGPFERNDLFAILFSIPSILLIYFGMRGHEWLLMIGIGILCYGVIYFIFHDVIVHRRIPHRYRPKSGYMGRIVQAHWIHHATRVKHGAVSFGFLYAPPIETLKRQSAG